ncbi:MAG: PQQ-like beta-propeller repeat protein [Phycisphaerales bacterium]|jgi:outer membrane protein assembly factor BamB|nr:PQQ-like beta-propeller repeat protein [Phycisphaerales bacterium]MBT7171221.1 PQQ-like beta-propeller repeat protein [Phycisphaerales bacterium]
MKRTALTILLLTTAVMAAGFEGYLGPKRDGQYPQVNSIGKKLWTKSIGTGYSNVTVVGDALYTMGNSNGMDTVYCLEAKTGKTTWTHTYRCSDGNFRGPRCTPSVFDGKVYTVSREGHILCLNAKTGKPVWESHAKKFRCRPGRWGFANSPLIHDGLCVIDIGRIVAFDAKTGKTKWQTRTDYGQAYSSAIPMTLPGDKTVLLTFPARGLVVLDPKTGKALGSIAWETKYNINAATPLIVGTNRVFISSDYDRGCAMLEIDATGKVKKVWENKNMCTHFSNPMLHKGYLYGFSGNTTKTPPLVCLDAKTGKRTWSKKGIGDGGLIACGTNMIVIGNRGTVYLAPFSATGFKATQTLKVFNTKPCWTSPCVAGKMVFFRDNPKSSKTATLVCYEVK